MGFAPNSPNEAQELEIKGLEKIRKGLLYLTVLLPLIIAGDFLIFKAYIYKISGEVGGLMLFTAFMLSIIALILFFIHMEYSVIMSKEKH
ncbi:hypothetical protein [Stygiolobus azoricus]|uniref:Uncharacterized protein n=1 Tax=Stygiolobus azoricus TaxID=41675 RepID=A0A650CPQ4_9CREN|nr:hypothetical protein [Stygiolobus azoricus]QGR19768.1 hypothetical protein D1868_07075 [Stygiolobus azoricus]